MPTFSLMQPISKLIDLAECPHQPYLYALYSEEKRDSYEVYVEVYDVSGEAIASLGKFT